MAAERNWEQLDIAVGTVFTPAVPVSESELFAGRMDQIRRVMDAVNQRGQHAAIYGERGVGKTSLANILGARIVSGIPVLSPRVNCDSTDDFTRLWKKVFSQIDLIKKKAAPGFHNTLLQETTTAAEAVSDDVSPDEVRRFLTILSDQQLVIIIFDEFDRVTDVAARRAMADTIKALSDHAVRATIIIVGVADTIGELISEHESVERALAQVPMPRMSMAELEDFLVRGTARVGMEISDVARDQIARISQGLPHYVHLLGLHAARQAIDDKRVRIEQGDVLPAMKKAVEQAQQSLRDDYRKATASPQKANLYSEVLLACAMAVTDEFGYFTAGDVRGPLSGIMGKTYGIPSFAKHLNDFCQAGRGSVLKKSGEKHKFFYRFSSPLMQPLIIMKGVIDGHVKPN